VTNNPALPDAAVEALIEAIGEDDIGGAIEVTGNGG
jgi:hypothetical protein